MAEVLHLDVASGRDQSHSRIISWSIPFGPKRIDLEGMGYHGDDVRLAGLPLGSER